MNFDTRKLRDIKTPFYLACVLCIFVIIIIICWRSNNDPTVVKTESGKIKGVLLQASYASKYDYSYYAFLGIPYAKPPVGPLRFQDPEPVESWSNVRETFKFGSVCPQRNRSARASIGEDDCLYLNIYTKHLDSHKRQPVMVWIHGGRFALGSGNRDISGPDYLLRKDVVLVTINYRLGAFGFFNLEEEIAPGNQGLKDQVMALKWVKQNILNFGGDPDSVTIFGVSAGGVSVHYLTLSPLAKGLFHRAIAQSGLAHNFRMANMNPREYSLELARQVDCYSEDTKKIVECLKNVNSSKIVMAQHSIFSSKERTQMVFPFCPGIDVKSKIPFLPKPVHDLVKDGVAIPFLYGHTNREGLFFLPRVNKYPEINNNFKDYLHPLVLEMLRSYHLTAEDLKLMYFDHKNISSENKGQYADFLTDLNFVYGAHKLAEYQIENNHSKTYLYRFDYDKGFSRYRDFANITLPGATHGDEIGFLFSFSRWSTLSKNNESSYRVMELMTELWTNFAKTGNPNPKVSNLLTVEWKPLKDYHSLDLLIIKENLQPTTLKSLLDKYSNHKINSY